MGTGGWAPGRIEGGRGVGGRGREGRKPDSYGGGNWKKLRVATLHNILQL